MTHACSKCGDDYEPTESQIRKRHWRCARCRSRYNHAQYVKSGYKRKEKPVKAKREFKPQPRRDAAISACYVDPDFESMYG